MACEAAKRHGVTISVDLNFRKKLWTSEKAISVMRPLMKYVDVCIGNEEDAQLCLGFKPDADVEGGKTDAEGYYGIFKGMMEEFGFKYVVSTLRESLSASHNGWKALIYDGKEFYQSKHYDIMPIIDRVGGGDSFSGGLIHGLLTKATQGEALGCCGSFRLEAYHTRRFQFGVCRRGGILGGRKCQWQSAKITN